MAGVLGSLVSITAICGVVRPGESLAIGFIGSAIAIFGWQLLNKIRIDDPVGAISTHAGGSIWGMIAVGLFVEKDSLEKPFSTTYGAFKGGHVRILGVQLLACVSITAWTLVTVFIQLYVIDKCVGLRMPLKEEIIGADACEHGIDQSQVSIEGHVAPVLASDNRVFPEQIGEGEEHSATRSDNDDNNLAANERHDENAIEGSDHEAQDYEQSVTGMPNDLQSSETLPKKDKPKNKKSSPVNSWSKIVSSNRRVNTSNEDHQQFRSSAFQRKKNPVIITLTPADEDREFRLSVNDLHKLKE